MPNKTWVVRASCAIALLASLAASGCGDDDEGGRGGREEAVDVLDGRNPCRLVDQAVVARISNTRIVTAEPAGGPTGAVKHCNYNLDEPAIRLIFTVVAAADALSMSDLIADEGVTTRAITVPGADEATVGRFGAPSHPQVSGCAFMEGGDRKLVCVSIGDHSAEPAPDQLEPMAIELLGRLVETL
jgi:hypothetical protein